MGFASAVAAWQDAKEEREDKLLAQRASLSITPQELNLDSSSPIVEATIKLLNDAKQAFPGNDFIIIGDKVFTLITELAAGPIYKEILRDSEGKPYVDARLYLETISGSLQRLNSLDHARLFPFPDERLTQMPLTGFYEA